MGKIGKRLSEFKDIHKGSSIIVCGCGRSLLDIKAHQKDFITIGVNDVPKLFTPTYLAVTDHPQRFAIPRRKLIMESESKAVFTCTKGWRGKNIVMFELGSRKVHNLDNPDKVDHFMNSPYVATGIAYKMGAKNIGIIGVDFTSDHFYAKDGHHPLTRMKRVRHVDNAYGVLVDEFKKEIDSHYNLSKYTARKAIPKRTREKVKKL